MMASESLQTATLARGVKGYHEAEFSFKGECDLHKHLVECDKNPGHPNFIPVTQFGVTDLPDGYQDPDIVSYVLSQAELTVRVVCKHTSQHRPEGYSFCHYRGASFLRTGTGFVQYVYKNEGRTDKPCPCPECVLSGNPQKEWAKVKVRTATHVVFDDSEAKKTVVELFYDDEKEKRKKVKKIYGDNVRFGATQGDWCDIRCVTHDLDLVDYLKDAWGRWRWLEMKVNEKYWGSGDDGSEDGEENEENGDEKKVGEGDDVGSSDLLEQEGAQFGPTRTNSLSSDTRMEKMMDHDDVNAKKGCEREYNHGDAHSTDMNSSKEDEGRISSTDETTSERNNTAVDEKVAFAENSICEGEQRNDLGVTSFDSGISGDVNMKENRQSITVKSEQTVLVGSSGCDNDKVINATVDPKILDLCPENENPRSGKSAVVDIEKTDNLAKKPGCDQSNAVSEEAGESVQKMKNILNDDDQLGTDVAAKDFESLNKTNVSTTRILQKRTKRKAKTEHRLAIIVSHPHGCNKQVSVGQWVERSVIDRSNGWENTVFTYDTPTCPGSSGAPVWLLGRMRWGGFFGRHPHSGRPLEGLNLSAVGWDRVN